MSDPTVRVFVSSTWLDLKPERAAVEKVALRIKKIQLCGMEHFGSRDETTEQASLNDVDGSHVYVGIFAGRYGSGITEKEYRRARERRLPCCIYFKARASITLDKSEEDPEQIARLTKLKEELRQTHTVVEFSSPEDLAAKLTADLYDLIAAKFSRKSPDTESSAPTINALHQMPPPPRDFTGRESELGELMAQIERGGATISGLQGQGGIGKTALALKLAERLKPRYPDAQFYLDLKGVSSKPVTVAEALAHVIRAYHPAAKLPEGEAELRGLYLSVLDNKRALLLMDNASEREQVEPLIPPDGCVLLVTSRQHFHLPGLFAKRLDTLSPEESRALLLKIAPRIGEHADTIATLCGHLPLALRLAASALAERRDLSASDYARRLTDARKRLELVEASLALSYDLLTPDLQKLWHTLAVFPDTFDTLAAAAVWEMEQDATQDALGELVKFSLLEWDEETTRYGLHDLARLFADARLSEAEREAGRKLHAAHYLSVLGAAHGLYLQGGDALKRGLSLFNLEWRNVQMGQTWAEGRAEADEAAALCSAYPTAGLYLLDLRQHPRERIHWLEVALTAARRLKDRGAEGAHLGNLGLAYDDLGEYRRAIEFYEQYLTIARETGDRLGEGNALGNLGVAYKNLGETRRAIEFYEQALVIDKEIGYRRGEGADLGNLGNAYAALGETHRAIEFHEQRLDIAREIGYRRDEGAALGNLGLAYDDLGEYRRAIEFYEQYLTIAREIGDRRGEGNALYNASLTLNELGDRAQAIANAEAALEIYEQIESPHTAKVREVLAQWRGQE